MKSYHLPPRIIFISTLCTLFIFELSSGETFPTPDILKDNVEFWKKIYTEVSLEEGLIHDNKYPLIIYKKAKYVSSSRRQRKRYITAEKSRIKTLLNRINSEPESSWSARAKEIAALFKKYAPPGALSTATGRIRFQRGQKERYRQGLYRSGALLDTIKAVLTQYNIPLRLAFLPHVESSFLADAYSKVGAAGLWQFMRSTGRIYMTINYSIDERRDPILSTYAAAKLLSHNYSQLHSWPLAITAYNHGLGGMKRAVKQTGSRDISVIIQKHKGRSFRFASKNFYSCFLAASEIAQNPKKYFPDITFAPPLKYQDITLSYFMRPKTLASLTGISIKELRKLNPAIRPVVYQQNKLIPQGATIHLPLKLSLAKVKESLHSLPDSLKITAPPRPKYYKVRRGDNLYAIARRFKVPARDLALENNISRMNRIYSGQVLRIPGRISAIKKAPPKIVAIKDEKEPVKKEKEMVKEVKIPPKVHQKPPEEIPDTLKEILMAKAETVPQSNIAVKSNNSPKFDAEVYTIDTEYEPGEKRAVIRISLNETLGHFAEWLDIPTQRIREVNHMGGRSTIQIHQELFIPAENKGVVENFNQRRLEYHMALEEDFYSQYKITELKPKTIRRGETLWDICNEDGIIPLWLLKKYNKHVDIIRLYPQMKIWLPVVGEKTELDLKQEANTEWRGIHPMYEEPTWSAKLWHFIP